MTQISFRVEGNLPPKKDGANSMWNKAVEAPRLIALRRQALEALGSKSPFSREIRMKVVVHIGGSNIGAVGDLDTFITGICDGLMKAHPRAKLHQLFCTLENISVNPRKEFVIDDDSQIIEIHAKKLVGESGSDWYEIEIRSE